MRRLVVPAVLLMLAAPHVVCAQDPATLEPRLLATLREMNAAFDKRDTATVRRFLTDDYTSTEPNGQTFRASQVIARATNNPPDLVVHEEQLTPTTRVSAGGDSAVVRYRSVVSIERGGQKMGTVRAWQTVTFVRRGDAWLVASTRRSYEPTKE